MLKKVSASGNADFIACVYEKKEHKINNSLIDPDAVMIIKKIRSFGDEAYVVGGAVRDLMLGKRPKDFDIATSMTPNKLRARFRNVRIIGRRFKLAHFHFSDSKIIEVATFRSLESKANANAYGNIEEDVRRRDFTVNALYYDPISSKVYDYVGGYQDLVEKHRLVGIMDMSEIFKEDPVRIIRGVKYSIKDGLAIGSRLYARMKEDAHLIENISPSRMYEELVKILMSGQSFEIFKGLQRVGILSFILPKVSYDIRIGNPVLEANMRFFDTVANSVPLSRSKATQLGAYSLIAHAYNKISIREGESNEVTKKDLFTSLKVIFRHFNISNGDTESIADMLMRRTSVLLDRDANLRGLDERN